MDATPSSHYTPEEFARLINAALLRDDTPTAGKIANRIYNDIMMGEGAFARLSRMVEGEGMKLISRDLPTSLLGSPSSPTNVIPASLRPGMQAKIEAELRKYLESDAVKAEVQAIYDEMCDSIERAGWAYGIVNLPDALSMVREKIRKQVKVYERSIALVGPYTDLEPLYEAACRITLNEKMRSKNYIDVQDFYTALCDNTRSSCTEIVAKFSRDVLEALAEWPRFQAIIDSNSTLLERCRLIAAKSPDKPKYRVFSDPDRSSPTDLLGV